MAPGPVQHNRADSNTNATEISCQIQRHLPSQLTTGCVLSPQNQGSINSFDPKYTDQTAQLSSEIEHLKQQLHMKTCENKDMKDQLKKHEDRALKQTREFAKEVEGVVNSI